MAFHRARCLVIVAIALFALLACTGARDVEPSRNDGEKYKPRSRYETLYGKETGPVSAKGGRDSVYRKLYPTRPSTSDSVNYEQFPSTTSTSIPLQQKDNNKATTVDFKKADSEAEHHLTAPHLVLGMSCGCLVLLVIWLVCKDSFQAIEITQPTSNEVGRATSTGVEQQSATITEVEVSHNQDQQNEETKTVEEDAFEQDKEPKDREIVAGESSDPKMEEMGSDGKGEEVEAAEDLYDFVEIPADLKEKVISRRIDPESDEEEKEGPKDEEQDETTTQTMVVAQVSATRVETEYRLASLPRKESDAKIQLLQQQLSLNLDLNQLNEELKANILVKTIEMQQTSERDEEQARHNRAKEEQQRLKHLEEQKLKVYQVDRRDMYRLMVVCSFIAIVSWVIVMRLKANDILMELLDTWWTVFSLLLSNVGIHNSSLVSDQSRFNYLPNVVGDVLVSAVTVIVAAILMMILVTFVLQFPRAGLLLVYAGLFRVFFASMVRLGFYLSFTVFLFQYWAFTKLTLNYPHLDYNRFWFRLKIILASCLGSILVGVCCVSGDPLNPYPQPFFWESWLVYLLM